MTSVNLKNVNLEYPIYNQNSRSLKKFLISSATGGKFKSNKAGEVSVKALSDINLSFSPGERVAIVGHNGSGKSTFLRLVAGVYKETTGNVKIVGKVGSLIDIGLGIDGDATGIDNIFIRSAILGIPKQYVEKNLDEIVNFSELGDFINMPVRTYSTGMLLRLAFTVSTLMTPDILLMDEWLSVGDSSFNSKAELRLKSVIERTKILIIATHSEDLVRKVCNIFIRLEHGSVVYDGSVNDYYGA